VKTCGERTLNRLRSVLGFAVPCLRLLLGFPCYFPSSVAQAQIEHERLLDLENSGRGKRNKTMVVYHEDDGADGDEGDKEWAAAGSSSSSSSSLSLEKEPVQLQASPTSGAAPRPRPPKQAAKRTGGAGADDAAPPRKRAPAREKKKREMYGCSACAFVSADFDVISKHVLTHGDPSVGSPSLTARLIALRNQLVLQHAAV
jgi:hypothetical protein